MTRKDYNLIAEAISLTLDECYKQKLLFNVYLLIDYLKKVLTKDNPNFDSELFVKAIAAKSTAVKKAK